MIASLSLKKYEKKFIAAAMQKALTAPLRPPSACPTSTRKTVIAVSKNAVLILFPMAVYVDATPEPQDAPIRAGP